MNILVLSTKLPYPPKDGGAIATLNLSLGLSEAGCNVTMLTFNTRKHFFPPEDLPSQITEKIYIECVETDTSLKLFEALKNLLFTRKPYISERFNKKNFEDKLEVLLKKSEFDIVQMEGPYLSHYIPLIRSLSKAKIAIRAHNIEHEIWKGKAKNEQGILTRLYLMNLAKRIRKFEKDGFGLVDMIIPISERDQSAVQAMHPAIPCLTIPTGINIEDYPERTSVSANSIFFLGSLDWLPNQEGLVWLKKKVLPHMDQKDENAVLHFAGRNAPHEFLQAMKHPSLIYHGEVEDARAFMSRYNIMAVPLLTGSGIRIKILEGMAMGKCVVTTSIGAEGIPVTEGENILIANDGPSFADHLKNLMSDKSLSEQISRNARKFIQKNFDNFAISQRLRDFYKKQS
jgi:polysaccharide biosynthesis protein PslH